MLPENRTAFESFIYDGVFNYWIKNKYLVEADPSKREVLKDICMAGLNGVKWADNFEQRTADQSVNIGNPTFDETFLFWPNIGVTIPLYKDFISYLHTAKKGVTVVQIGCSSGRETDYFSQLFTDISFVGTDIDEMIIDRARKKHRRSNLSFKIARAHEICNVMPDDIPLIFCAIGSLEYVQPEHLEMMFKTMSHRGNISFFIHATWHEIGGIETRDPRTRYRDNLSYSHNYKEFAESAGLKTVSMITTQPYPHYKTWQRHLHHYYYICKTQ